MATNTPVAMNEKRQEEKPAMNVPRGTPITVAHVTPPLIRLLASASTGTGELPGLRLVVSGGDVLRGTDVAAVRDLAPGATVVNAYGATETPQVMAWQPIPPEVACAPTADVVPVGTAIDGVDLQVVRADGRPAGVGELGRIVLRTPYLSREYLAAREFRTGDLGRLRPDGRVALAGRSDRQVKVSGFRVDPGSVETLVRALPYIDDCVTVPRADPDGETRLVAYAVPTPGAVPSIQRLRQDLRAQAPEHMLPAGLVTLARLPLSPNGKVDTAALPPWEPGTAGGPDPAEAPATALENLIAAVWGDVLQAGQISASASFFDLGGSSLLMTRAGQRLSRELGRPVPVLTLFEYPTVRALAGHLEGAQPDGPSDPAPRRFTAPDARRRLSIRREIQQGVS